jgi:hypothetical protein
MYDDDDYDDYDEYDDEGELYPIVLPQTEPTVSFLISQFFMEADRKEKQVSQDVVRALSRIYDKHGDDYSSVAIMNYVGRRMGWDMEILMEKYEVEDHLMNTYHLFDDEIWLKVLGTNAMSDLRREVFSLSQTYLARAVREVLEREQRSISPMGDPLL